MSLSHEDTITDLNSKIKKTRQALQVIKDSMKPLEAQLLDYERQLSQTHRQVEIATSPAKLKEFLKLQPQISQWLDSQKVDFIAPITNVMTVSTSLTINDLQIRAQVTDDGGYHPKDYRVEVYLKGKYLCQINERWLHCITMHSEDNTSASLKRLLERKLGLSASNDKIGDFPKSDYHELTGNWEPTYLITYWFLSAVVALESGW